MTKEALMIVRALAVLSAIALVAGPARGDTIYVDTSAVDNIPGLTDAQKATLKQKIVDHVKNNFQSADSGFTVTDDSSKASSADRTVKLNWSLGQDSTGYYYGEWSHGSKSSDVYLKNFTDRHGSDYKTGDPPAWDLDKLANGIGRTAAHEVAHSYSAGHNSSSPPNKMTEGGKVPSSQRANNSWDFDTHTKNTLKKNKGKKPCKTTSDYDADCLRPTLVQPQSTIGPYDTEEPAESFFDVLFQFDGPLASDFELGWIGEDSDGGLDDGDPEFDFIYKSAMDAGDPTQNAEMLTFILDAHQSVHFALRALGDGPGWSAGQWLPMADAEVLLESPDMTPGGEEYFRMVQVLWDLDIEQPGAEVGIVLDAMALDPGAQYGFTVVPEPTCLALLGLGAAALLRRWRTA